MSGANTVHKRLREELENYIRAQYLGKSPVLLEALGDELDRPGVLYQKPYIEASPAYVSVPNGIQQARIPDWLKSFFASLSDAHLGVYSTPYRHQIEALKATYEGNDLFVSTGTGSGKTECFMWPLIAKLATEARERPESWHQRGVRAIVMYPMNALVSDQMSRLRRLIGDPDGRFIEIFKEFTSPCVRRPQFGMYTGRTPYPGNKTNKQSDLALVRTLKRITADSTELSSSVYNKLLADGKIPAKDDIQAFCDRLRDSDHTPSEADAELITRFEMQQCAPDILITNYSMLEYMLFRPIEANIWNQTKQWLDADEANKLLFIIDEAHMYRGSSGGEVALLIRRLFHRLGIKRDRVQFILTTASMPDSGEDDREAVMQFANDLTSQTDNKTFVFLTGTQESVSCQDTIDIAPERYTRCKAEEFENESSCIRALETFLGGMDGVPERFESPEASYAWLYEHLLHYTPFAQLLEKCRGTAVSLDELAQGIFPGMSYDDGIHAVSILLAIAPLARNSSGAVLFPARMHMLFRGLNGIFACTNENCPCAHKVGGLTLGSLHTSDDRFVCPDCGSVVYELYNDRRCGALFYKGYVVDDDYKSKDYAYLWHYPGQFRQLKIHEIHLYIPPEGYFPSGGRTKNPIKPCYLDTKSGYLYFRDDSMAGKPGFRMLFYCESDNNSKIADKAITFTKCPHCKQLLSSMQLTSFGTKGNLAFYSLIQSQFNAQPPVAGKTGDPEHFPNEGRKVLLFSDSRQRAAKLARDMSEASDLAAVMQLFALAIRKLEESNRCDRSLNDIYGYFCLVVLEHNIPIFSSDIKFGEDCQRVSESLQRATSRGRPFEPRITMQHASDSMQKALLHIFCGGYNTLFDSAICWIEPTEEALDDALYSLKENGISIEETEFLELFNAWILDIFDSHLALGDDISDSIRYEVRQCFSGFGLESNWEFSTTINEIMKWKKNSEVAHKWARVLQNIFLSNSQESQKYYVAMNHIRPRFDRSHTWYRCKQCADVSPFMLKSHCPRCGSEQIEAFNQIDELALQFWRKPIEDAIGGKCIRTIDTEEHTAQLSYKDQRDELWSKTETYELRFQDLLQDGEKPVDILSSTTTMEVGIDIGSLVAVGLRNIPPMRENYQQRAGRAGRKGASLSTITTYCENGPHDTLYFNHPEPMFRGDPRRPWIDVQSEKLYRRHLSMIAVSDYLGQNGLGLDTIPAYVFVDSHLDSFATFLSSFEPSDVDPLIVQSFDNREFKKELMKCLNAIRAKRNAHPELFGIQEDVSNNSFSQPKSLLDALYDDGIIPTYSFPKNVVNTYIFNPDRAGQVMFEVGRGLDIAISEYAPGRAIVVDKQTYQIGGLYYPGSERKRGLYGNAARPYIDDSSYLKPIKQCPDCHWFGLESDDNRRCPFCGNDKLTDIHPMLIPWGFAPKNGKSIKEAQLKEHYSFSTMPLYSTVSSADDVNPVPGCVNIRMATRENQRIIMLNRGCDANHSGFYVCRDCGAAIPAGTTESFKELCRPYPLRYGNKPCKHDFVQVNLGYDFITDMLVLEFYLDPRQIDVHTKDNLWLTRSAQSFAEVFRLAVSKELDIEYAELVSGYRIRHNHSGCWVDIYLYDSLSSGAGYAVSLAQQIPQLLNRVENVLLHCSCDSACYNCLMHYRNQNIHGLLDRHCALQLLEWGKNGVLADGIDLDTQFNLLRPVENIITSIRSGTIIHYDATGISIEFSGIKKNIVIYPAMLLEPTKDNTIFISDIELKYARPLAVKKLLGD